MEVETKEQVDTTEEQEEQGTSEAEAEVAPEVSEESEGEAEGEAPKLSEEVKQGIIKEEYAKWQSKTLTPITKERDALNKQVAELNAKLEEKNDNRDIDLLYQGDVEEFGEDKAKEYKNIREKEAPLIRAYKANAKMVTEAAEIAKRLADEFTPQVATSLGFTDKTPIGALKAASNAIRATGISARHQMAVERAYELLIPADKTFQKQLGEIVEELEQAETPEHMDRLLKIIIRERGGNKKPFTPDSSRQSGSGVAWSKLSREEKDKIITKELEKEKQQAGG